MDQTETISELRREVAGMRFGLFLVATGGLIALALWNVFAIGNIPRMEKIFEDMLGSRDKLPELTKWIIGYGRAGAGLMPIVVVGFLTVISWSVMLLMRHTWKFLLVAIVAALLLTVHGQIIGTGLNMPLMQIIQGINEHS